MSGSSGITEERGERTDTERECDCGHREHPGRCIARHTYYAPATVPLPEGATEIPTHKYAKDAGLRAYTVPCDCDAFRDAVDTDRTETGTDRGGL